MEEGDGGGGGGAGEEAQGAAAHVAHCTEQDTAAEAIGSVQHVRNGQRREEEHYGSVVDEELQGVLGQRVD